MDPQNILLAGGTSPRMGPLHAQNICAIGLHWPIEDVVHLRTGLPCEPT
jgi:hypothetical protein